MEHVTNNLNIILDLNKHVLKEHTKLFVPIFTQAQEKIKKVQSNFNEAIF